MTLFLKALREKPYFTGEELFEKCRGITVAERDLFLGKVKQQLETLLIGDWPEAWIKVMEREDCLRVIRESIELQSQDKACGAGLFWRHNFADFKKFLEECFSHVISNKLPTYKFSKSQISKAWTRVSQGVTCQGDGFTLILSPKKGLIILINRPTGEQLVIKKRVSYMSKVVLIGTTALMYNDSSFTYDYYFDTSVLKTATQSDQIKLKKLRIDYGKFLPLADTDCLWSLRLPLNSISNAFYAKQIKFINNHPGTEENRTSFLLRGLHCRRPLPVPERKCPNSWYE